MTTSPQKNALHKNMDDYRESAVADVEAWGMGGPTAPEVVNEILEKLFEQMRNRIRSNHEEMELNKFFPEYEEPQNP